MRVFGIDPGCNRTGYGCIDSDGRRHRLVLCGAIAAATTLRFPTSSRHSSRARGGARECRPECVAIENLFHATNVRSALKLGHARGVAMLAAVEAGLPRSSNTRPRRSSAPSSAMGAPKRRKSARWSTCCLRLDCVPAPHDAADALAVAICHLHAAKWGLTRFSARSAKSGSDAFLPATSWKSWRQYRPRA